MLGGVGPPQLGHHPVLGGQDLVVHPAEGGGQEVPPRGVDVEGGGGGAGRQLGGQKGGGAGRAEGKVGDGEGGDGEDVDRGGERGAVPGDKGLLDVVAGQEEAGEDDDDPGHLQGGRVIRYSKILSDFCSRGLNHLILHLKRPRRSRAGHFKYF